MTPEQQALNRRLLAANADTAREMCGCRACWTASSTRAQTQAPLTCLASALLLALELQTLADSLCAAIGMVS